MLKTTHNTLDELKDNKQFSTYFTNALKNRDQLKLMVILCKYLYLTLYDNIINSSHILVRSLDMLNLYLVRTDSFIIKKIVELESNYYDFTITFWDKTRFVQLVSKDILLTSICDKLLEETRSNNIDDTESTGLINKFREHITMNPTELGKALHNLYTDTMQLLFDMLKFNFVRVDVQNYLKLEPQERDQSKISNIKNLKTSPTFTFNPAEPRKLFSPAYNLYTVLKKHNEFDNGYEKKYLHYKYKYLQLKNQLKK